MRIVKDKIKTFDPLFKGEVFEIFDEISINVEFELLKRENVKNEILTIIFYKQKMEVEYLLIETALIYNELCKKDNLIAKYLIKTIIRRIDDVNINEFLLITLLQNIYCFY